MTEQTTETTTIEVPVDQAREGDLLTLRTGETTVQGRLRTSTAAETLEIPHAGWSLANIATLGNNWESVKVERRVPLPEIPTEHGTTFTAHVRDSAERMVVLVGDNSDGATTYLTATFLRRDSGMHWEHGPEHIDRASIRNVITPEQHAGDLDAPRPALRAALVALAVRIDGLQVELPYTEQQAAVVADLHALAGDA